MKTDITGTLHEDRLMGTLYKDQYNGYFIQRPI
jgi:hypothetical protein